MELDYVLATVALVEMANFYTSVYAAVAHDGILVFVMMLGGDDLVFVATCVILAARAVVDIPVSRALLDSKSPAWADTSPAAGSIRVALAAVDEVDNGP